MQVTTDVNKCTQCNALCCKHVAIQIDTPKKKQDFDYIRWYLLHEKVWVSIDLDGKWLLEFRTPCSMLTSSNTCGCYDTRPTICRNYPSDDEFCEGETDLPAYRHLFTCLEDFEAYQQRNASDATKVVPLAASA
jgi:uncharacterized protein